MNVYMYVWRKGIKDEFLYNLIEIYIVRKFNAFVIYCNYCKQKTFLILLHTFLKDKSAINTEADSLLPSIWSICWQVWRHMSIFFESIWSCARATKISRSFGVYLMQSSKRLIASSLPFNLIDCWAIKIHILKQLYALLI